MSLSLHAVAGQENSGPVGRLASSLRGLLCGSMVVGTLALLGVGAVLTAPAASADFLPHTTLVPQTPARGYPAILTTPLYVNGGTPNYNQPVGRETYALEQVGRAIVSGGDFFEIQLQDDSVIQQKYFAAWSLDSKAMICQQQFTFDNEVLSIEPGPTPTTLYVGGRFSKITGADGVARTRNRIAMIDLADCSVNKTFVPGTANGKVDEIEYGGGRLFLGGDFTTVNGVAVETVAELDPTTGALKTPFNFVTAGESSSRIRGMELNSANTRLVLAGRFGTITRNGVSIPAPTAILDISNPADPTLTNHRTTGITVAITDLQDASVAPDSSVIGLAYGTATVSDYVYLTPTTEASVAFQWRHYMRDSSFGIGISNNAVYVSGHFCKPDSGPGASDLMAPASGLDVCTGSGMTGGVWRSHLAALSLTDGTPLAWNPGQASHTGGRAITVVTRGLLVGYDGERTAEQLVGTSTLFDFGAAVEDTTPPSSVTYTSPVAGTPLNNPARISGSATDNVGVASYKFTMQHTDGRWVQADGTLAALRYDFSAPADINGAFAVDVSMPAGTYTVKARALDGAGLRSVVETPITLVQTGIESIKPESTLNVPVADTPLETRVDVTGVATDNVAVTSITATIRNGAGKYVQDDGTLAAAANDYPLSITAGALGSTSATWSMDLGRRLPEGNYTVALTVTDASGNVTTVNKSFKMVVDPASLPVVTLSSPLATQSNESRVKITGTATDNWQIDTIQVQLTNAAGLFLQDDSTFGAAENDLDATVTGLGTASATFDFNAGLRPVGTYRATVKATDPAGNITTKTQDVTLTDLVSTELPALTAGTEASNNRGAYTLGYAFTVKSATKLTSIGIYDQDKDGVFDNTQATSAGIWRQSTGALLGQTSVTPGTAAQGGWFYGTVATPITLDPGVTYIVGYQTFSSGESYSRGTVTQGANITVGNGFYLSSGTFGRPTIDYGTTKLGFPNMKFLTEVSSKPVVTITSPTADLLVGQTATLTATATDNAEVESLEITLQRANGDYLKNDGSFGAGATNLAATKTGLATASAQATYAAANLPAAAYTMTATAVDPTGNSTAVTKAFNVTAVPTNVPALTAYTQTTASKGAFTMGYAFTVKRTTSLSAIGIADQDKDGVFDNTQATPAGIWNQSNGSLLGQASVSVGTAAQGGWFYGNLATPVVLQPGVTYVVAYQTFSAGESYITGSVTPGDNITVGNGYYRSSTTFGYPTTNYGTTKLGIPNMKFTG